MSTLRESVESYLLMRRAMGFKVEGLAKLLISFAKYCHDRGIDHVRTDIAVQWATSQIKVPVNDALFARRMDAVKIFAKHQRALDPATEIPSEGICNRRYQPREPNVFTPAQVVALQEATDALRPQFRALTWRNLIGLLAVTGMRPGEACRLSIEDIDLDRGVIQILETKFGKSRLVFLHPTATQMLTHYLRVRTDWTATTTTDCPMVFLNTRGTAITSGRLSTTFNQLAATAGITSGRGHRRPRLHDLRHTFAVTTLLEWYRAGEEVQARLPMLSTWLGHADPASTYWYLHAVPELLEQAADRRTAHEDSQRMEAAS